MQKPEKTNAKKDIRVKYLRDHISLTVGNFYMHSLSQIALFVYDIFLSFWGSFLIPI